MSEIAKAAQPAEIADWSVGRQRYTLGLLVVIYTLGFLDRQIINILAEPIKNDLGLTDGELGALTGLAFALFYTLMGLPIARLADRHSRPAIISTSVFVWSGFTALCGTATSFASLFAMRIGVGVGEAGCNPPAVSLIADFVPRARRASAMAVYALGNPLGSLLGLAFGGVVAGFFGWRTAFFVAGVPGILIAILALATLREPRSSLKVSAASPPPFIEAVRQIAARRSFWLLGLGAAMMAFVSYGKVAFYGSFFLRNHGDQLTASTTAFDAASGLALPPLAFLGILLGVLMGVAGGIGVILGGRIADRAALRGVSAYMNAPALAGVGQIPFFVTALYVDDLWLSLALFCIPAVLTAFWFGPVFATVVGLVEPRVRAMCGASLQLVINIVGLGLGPLTVGLLSAALAGTGGGDGASLRLSMAICSAAGVVATGCFLLAKRYLPEEFTG